jgi:pimeloyl-ACP methyl ester carboxylesterase
LASPERVAVAGVVAGMGQVGAWAAITDYEPDDELLMPLSVRRPRAARLVLGTMARAARLSPGLVLRAFERGLSPADRAAFPRAGTPRQTLAPFTQAFLRGASGVVDDYARLTRPWGFAVEGVTVPVRVWHGDEDTMVPIAHSHALAARLRPAPEVAVWRGAGHFGLVAHFDQILQDMRACGRASPAAR